MHGVIIVALCTFPVIVLVALKVVPLLILDRLFLFGRGELLSKAAETMIVLPWDIFPLLYCWYLVPESLLRYRSNRLCFSSLWLVQTPWQDTKDHLAFLLLVGVSCEERT